MIFERLRAWSNSQPLDLAQQAFFLEIANELGRTWLRQGQPKRAERLYQELLPQAGRLGDLRLLSIVTNNLARAILDQPSPALERVRRAVRLLESNLEQLATSPHARHLAVAHHDLGDAYLKLSDITTAEFHFRQDVKICRSTDDVEALADALDRLGVFLADRKPYAEARAVHEQEGALFERLYDLERQARALANLGRCYLGRGYADGDRPVLVQAAATLQRAAMLYSSLDKPKEYAPTLENLARTRYLLGDTQEGIRYLRESAAQYEQWPEGKVIAAEIGEEVLRLTQS